MLIRKFLLTTALCAFAGGAQAATNWAADVPLSACDGFPCITAQIGSAPAGVALIDTGNMVSFVDRTQADAVGFSKKPAADGQVHAARTTAQIGALTLKDVPAYAGGLKDAVAKGQMPHADATLAYTAFKDRIVQLDFVHHRFRVSAINPDKTDCKNDCAALHFITFGKEGPPIVVADGFSANGKPVTAQVDTLWPGSLLIYTASIDKLGLGAAAKVKASESFPYTDGGVKELKASAKTIGFAAETLAHNAPLYFPTPGVHEPDALFDGTVGDALFKDRVVTLDFHNMTMTIAKG